MESIALIICLFLGSLTGGLLACVPGWHVAGTLSVFLLMFSDSGIAGMAIPVFACLLASYSIVSFVPLVFLSVPDEGLFAAINPAQSLLRQGNGITGVMIGGLGAVIGIVFSAVILAAAGSSLLPRVLQVLRPHWHWIVWAVVLFMLMSEWPQRAGPGLTPFQRLIGAWRFLVPGLLVFIASGLLGIIVFFHRDAAPEGAFASIMPMVSGMFSVPWLLLGVISDQSPPKQQTGDSYVSCRDIMSGALSGCLGGMFAGIVPGVTAGVGGFLAGHTCSLKSRFGFIAAQGCSRSVYMCGAMMLMFVPGVEVTRGSSSAVLRSIHNPFPQVELPSVLAALLVSAAFSFAMLPLLAGCFLKVLGKAGSRRLAFASLLAVLIVNYFVTGPGGLLILAVAFLIGFSAILYGVRRMNCLGCILVPVGVALSGWGGFLS